MVARSFSTPDLRPTLARLLCCRLAELDCRPSVAGGMALWLARLPDAVERIDGGEYIIMASPASFIGQLFAPDAAVAAGAEHPDVTWFAIDCRPALAAVRAAIAEQN